MFKLFLLSLTFFSVSQLAVAEQETYPDHTIFYTALNSTYITPEISQQYGIRRSENRGLLTLAVHAKPDMPVPASIKVSSRSLLGKIEPISMQQVQEGTAIYYIGTFSMGHRETLTFNVSVAPEGKETPYLFDFSQEFYK